MQHVTNYSITVFGFVCFYIVFIFLFMFFACSNCFALSLMHINVNCFQQMLLVLFCCFQYSSHLFVLTRTYKLAYLRLFLFISL